MPPLRMRAFYDTTFQLEDQETGEIRDVAIKVRRFNDEAFQQFQRDYKRASDPPSNRMVLVRRQDGDEQERDHLSAAFKVPASTVMLRRLQEMTPEQRASYDAQDAIDEAFAKKFLRDAIVAHIRVPEGELEDEDAAGGVTAVQTGADLVQMFCARGDVLRQLVEAIWRENTMSGSEKKVQRSLSALRTSLQALLPEAPGAKPAAAATPAASAASAPTDTATADPGTTPCGSEAPPSP